MKATILAAISFLIIFTSCDNSGKKVNGQTGETIVRADVDYLNEGREIAETTFKVLSANLQNAMAEGGIENALSYCNVNAMPLTDSLSKHYNVTIKRVSDKTRNPLNAPTKEEQKVINDYLEKVENRKTVLEKGDNNKRTFYAPITTKGLCLNCHGTVGKTMLPENYEKIKMLYPNDKAIGYNEGDLRGIWSIEFKN